MPADPDTPWPRQLDARVARWFFAGGVAVSIGGVIAYAVLPLAVSTAARGLLVGGCLLMALIFALLHWRADRLPLERAVLVAAWVACVITGVMAIGLGGGVHTQVLGYWPLLIALVAVLGSVRAAAALMVACALMAAALALMEVTQGLPTRAAAGEGLLLPLITMTLMLGSGFVVGSLTSYLVRRSLRRAGERERRFRDLLDMSVDWHWELDAELRFVRFDTLAGSRSGAEASRQLGRTPWEVEESGLDEDQMDALRADLEARRPFSRVLLRDIDRHGHPRFISFSGRPRFARGGAFRGYWGVGHDITAEVRAQHAMHSSETRYRELFDRSPTPLVLHRGGRVIDANPAAASMCGFESADAMAGTDMLGLYAEGAPRERAIARIAEVERLNVGEGLPVAEFTLRSRDARSLEVQATAVRVMTAGGPATLSIYFDVTARRATEAALRRADALLSHLFATSPASLTLTEVGSGRYVMVNPGFTRLTGYSADEVIGRTAIEIGIWHGDDRERLVGAIEADGQVDGMELTLVTKTGALASIQASAARFEMAGQAYLVINAHDVTASERARLEHAAILQHAPIGIAFTRDGCFQQVNPSWERMFGCAPGQLVGKRLGTLWPEAPDEAALRADTPPAGAEPQVFEIVREMHRDDGSAFWCRLLGQHMNATHPVYGGTLWLAEDISERRRIDQALAAALVQAEAASRAKSAFLANTSHEIRTPLNELLGLARLTQRPALDATLRREYLAQIVESAQSLADIISDVLDLSKIEAGKFELEAEPFDLHELVRSAHRTYLALANAKGLLLTLTVADAVPGWVRGDRVRTRQILVNFLTNAIKFTAAGQVQVTLEVASQGRVRMSVADTGPGMDAATQRRLFMPFSQADESTTRRFGGTGLGLSICRELARLLGGEVGVHSVLGEGSRFWAELPLAPAAPTHAGPRADGADLARLRHARVLMVEDNPVNMLIAVAQLEQWGAMVDQAHDGQAAVEAVERAANEGRPFDVVLMDLQMPQMGGNDAARALRRRFTPQELPIIALTAAALVSERQRALQAGMNDFVSKPIDPDQLLRALGKALASGSERPVLDTH
ncbi:MAG: PAS domain S-box protein [Rhizobacter sp.]|nr:PAS domain S-box protein [Rhizobacter sp.]